MSEVAAERLEHYRAELESIYAGLDTDIAQAGSVCQLSGRCCRFAEYGHSLFVSAAEFAFLLAGAPEAQRPVDEGATCPWQDERGHCSARQARPLGCRVYYCEPGNQPLAQVLSEKYIARLRTMTDAHGLPWNYAPLHWHLKNAAETGAGPRIAVSAAQSPGPPKET